MDSFVEVGRRERKRQAVHQGLLDAAALLFRERGVSHTTVEDIAEAADVSRQTVFNHFPYKEALALELAAEGVRRIAQRAQALLDAGTNALDVLYYAAEWVLKSALEDGDIGVSVAQELLHPEAERAARARQQVPLSGIFHAILLQAREEGSVREDLPLELVASRLCINVTSLVAQATSSTPERLRDDLSICFDIWLNGITRRSA
jgi:AcrR family transcriptional regulator